MLKPIRVLPSETSDKFISTLTNDLCVTLQFILMGQNIQMPPFEPFCMPIDTYLNAYKKKSVMIKVDIEGESDRKIYVFFEITTAIIFGCMMRQITEAMLKDRLAKQDFSGPVLDAFGEISNQFTGTLDRILRNISKANIHLIMDFNKRVYPNEAISQEHFLNKEEYVVWVSTIALEGYDKTKVTMLFPQSTYEKIIGQRVKLAGITQKKILLYSWDKAFAEAVNEKVVSRHYAVEVISQYGDIIHLSKDPHCLIICIDFDRIPNPIPHDFKIFAKRMQMAKIPEEIPIWISMSNPSQEVCTEFENLGLRGCTTEDAKKGLIPWIQSNLDKLINKEA